MKNLMKSLVLVLAAGIMFTACGGGGSTPTSVVEKVLKATKDFDFKTVKNYVSKKYVADIDAVIEKMNTPEAKEYLNMAKAGMEAIKYEVVKEEIAEDGNSAKVTVKVNAMGQEQEQVMPLVKEDGEWKLDENPGAGK